EELHGADDVGVQDLDRARDARRAGGAEAPGVGAADEHGTRAEAERFDDVAAAADAAVEEDLDASIDRRDDLGEYAQRRSDAVQLPSAVVGYHDRRRAVIDRAAC